MAVNDSAPAAPSQKPSCRRRRLIVSTMQWKYAVTIGAVVFLVSAVLSCVLYGTLHQEARLRMLYPTSHASNTGLSVLLSALAFAALSAGAATFWMVIMTHRICGPLYVMEGHCRKLAGGRMPRLRALRRKDELKDFYRSFARAVDRIREDRQSQLAAVNKALVEAMAHRALDEGECRRALDSICRQLGDLRRQLSDSLELADAQPTTPAEQPATSAKPEHGPKPASTTSPQRPVRSASSPHDGGCVGGGGVPTENRPAEAESACQAANLMGASKGDCTHNGSAAPTLHKQFPVGVA